MTARVTDRPDATTLTLARELAASAAIMDAVSAAVVVVDADGRIAFANESVEALTGFNPLDLIGLDVETLVPEERRRRHREHRNRYAAHPARRPMGTDVGVSCARADGTAFVADISLAPLELGGRACVVVTIRDDTERRRVEADLAHRALHDPLTGLANRSLLFDRLTQALARAERSMCPVIVFYVDLDGFKDVNDDYGHGVGDAVLGEIAARLRSAVRPGDTVARIGGDEFVVVCEGIDETAATDELGARLVSAVSEPVQSGGLVVEVAASVGVVAAHGGPALDVIAAADQAMYRAKRAGGNRVCR